MEKYLGFQPVELGELVLGGSLYSVVNSGVKKVVPGVHQTLSGLPGGTALSPLLVGVLLNTIGALVSKQGGALAKVGNVVQMAGTGLVGSSAVAIGATIGSAIAPKIGLAGEDYTSLMGQEEGQFLLGYNGSEFDGEDFGGEDFGADFEGEDFGAEFEGEDELMGMV